MQESKSQRAPGSRGMPAVKEAESFSSEYDLPTLPEQSHKIEAASAETVRKMALGMHDVATQVRTPFCLIVLSCSFRQPVSAVCEAVGGH